MKKGYIFFPLLASLVLLQSCGTDSTGSTTDTSAQTSSTLSSQSSSSTTTQSQSVTSKTRAS